MRKLSLVDCARNLLQGEEEERLKRLEFVQTAATKGMACFSSLYGYAKENSGPLRPRVETVEGTVRKVVGPVYERVHSLPLQVLHFVDGKVESPQPDSLPVGTSPFSRSLNSTFPLLCSTMILFVRLNSNLLDEFNRALGFYGSKSRGRCRPFAFHALNLFSLDSFL